MVAANGSLIGYYVNQEVNNFTQPVDPLQQKNLTALVLVGQ